MSHPYLQMLRARAHTDDLYRDAAVARRAAEARRAAKTRRSASARGHRRCGLLTELATPEQAVTLRRSQEPIVHWVAASHRGQRLAALTVECEGVFVNAARSTVVFARAQLGRRQQPGCFDPEEVFVLNDLEPTLHAAGVRIMRHKLAHELI